MSNPREESVLGYSQKELDKIPNYILYIKALDNLVTQTFELNKTMNNIAESLRIISHNNR
jgi:hypothetical protein